MALDEDIQFALKTWRDGLVGLTRTSRLIKFNAPRMSSVLIDSPEPDEILARIHTGKLQQFRGDPPAKDGGSDRELPVAARSGAFLHSPRPETELGPVLRNLMRRATVEYIDKGLSVLYLAFGMLHWSDVDGTAMVSPILLVPVTLVPQGPKGTPRLEEAEDDAVINPALALRLKEFNIELPTADDFDDLSVAQVFDSVRAALKLSESFNEWELESEIYLATFSFAKEAMFKDLLDNEATILEHPVFRALATSDVNLQSEQFQFDAIESRDIDRVAPPELTPTVLDADSSQRIAISAALAGKSFVMDGPPGTGKSQTIANMIGALLHAGKSVLFVSEKMAALDVVRNRLADAGLGSYLLELHSHKASRREVAVQLLQALDNMPQPPNGMDTLSRAGAKDRREKLNRYAAAMNEVRAPLDLSLHDVLGRLAQLVDVPSAPIPHESPLNLSQTDFAAIQEEAKRLVRAWRPALEGSSYLWRAVEDPSSLDIRLYQAKTALEKLEGSIRPNATVASELGLLRPEDVPLLQEVLVRQHGDHPKDAIAATYAVADLGRVQQLRRSLGEALAAVHHAQAAVVTQSGVTWEELPDHAAPADELGDVHGAEDGVDLASLPAADLATTLQSFELHFEHLTDELVGAQRLARAMGLPQPKTFSDVDRAVKLVKWRGGVARLPRTWLRADGIAAANALFLELKDARRRLSTTETIAKRTFNDAAVAAPLAELEDRFSNLYKGLKKLSGGYRADKKALSAVLVEAASIKDGMSRLAEGIRWTSALNSFEELSRDAATVLGSQWRGRDTDFEAMGHDLDVAQRIVSLCESQVPNDVLSLYCDNDADLALEQVSQGVDKAFSEWRESLAAAPAPAARPFLLLEPVEESLRWLEAHFEPLRRAVSTVTSLDDVTGELHTLGEATKVFQLRAEVVGGLERLRALSADSEKFFGHHFNMLETDVDAIDELIAFAATVREHCGGALTDRQIRAIASSQEQGGLDGYYDSWVSARDVVVSAFAASRTDDLLAEFNDFGTSSELIEALRDDTTGQQEWFEYKGSRQRLAEFGLGPAVDFCVEQRILADQVPQVIDRAILRAWADAVLVQEVDLAPHLAKDRHALVEEYRKLDQALVVSATSEIVHSANQRRLANTAIGEPALIRREGTKQKRHMPVRELMDRARTAAQSVKPVFMMSPQAVSQYLPSTLTFDVVIFDEASQVTPGDAINCIYRSKAMILAGDDKQLPPTSFFDRVVDDEVLGDDTDAKDFQSVLELAKASGAFNNLGLKWHYRSRHEDLIAFSNYKFYDGKLVTYPSARTEGDNVGVTFYNAHGTYRRGGGADNPLEARTVAERVIEHYTTRPDLTLGVVTFSMAQADAVQDAIDEARDKRRDLDRFFDQANRLDGFFVRSLESVQGDERDVIIFSVGYGPDEAKKITANFGALNKDKGWRRLNVGITRARQRVEVVASMGGGDIPPSANESVEYLRAYLEYAERGISTLALQYGPTGLGPESPFEESVIAAITSWGYKVQAQVGAAGFRIDMGVLHPERPGRYVLGVECDGYQYHSAPAARDRDRLREQVLVGLGWNLHRIWGTAWYRNRVQEEQRLHAAIEAAIAHDSDGSSRDLSRFEIERPTVESIAVEASALHPWTSEYVKAQPVPLLYWVDPGEPGNDLHMIEGITAVAEAEGPVHMDVVFERLRSWWAVGRVSSRMRENVERAISRSSLTRDGDFIDIDGRVVAEVRTPNDEADRKVEQIHIEELALAAQFLVRDAGGASRAEVVQQVARLFGWGRTGPNVDRRVSEAVEVLLDRGVLMEESGHLRANAV